MTEVKGMFQVIAACPIHDRPVYLIIEAPGLEEAKEKALGMRVSCPWGGVEEAHVFDVEKVLSVSVYPWVPPVTVSAGPIPSVVVKEMITTDLGERFWILSRKGQKEFEDVQREVAGVARLVPVPAPVRGSASVGSAVVIALLVVGVSAGGYYLWKRFKSS